MNRSAKTSLRRRLIIVISIVAIAPILLIGVISFYAIDGTEKKLHSMVIASLQQVMREIDNTQRNMDYSSRQFVTVNGTVGGELRHLMESLSLYQTVEIHKAIRQKFALVNFTNPHLGIMFYYFPQSEKIMYSNLEIADNFFDRSFPVLSSSPVYSFNGPHRTVSKYHDDPVFSIQRKVDMIGDEDVYIFIETHPDVIKNVLNTDNYGFPAFHLLIDAQGTILFSGDKSQYAVGAQFQATPDKAQPFIQENGNKLFIETSEDGWKVVVGIPAKSLNKETSRWMLLMFIICAIALATAIILGLYLWRSVYRPLHHFGKDLKRSGTDLYYVPRTQTDIMEIDHLFIQFQQMRERLIHLFEEVKDKEKRKQQLEVEKLLVQINPHFLHNTLNTIQWLARMNGNEDIYKLVSVFSRVLHYNLGKEGGIVTIQEEVKALEDYLALQRIRYDTDFDVRIRIDPNALPLQIPRFVMQPLVENALYHGLVEEEGRIEIVVEVNQEQLVHVTVSDNGVGMSEDTIAGLMSAERDTRKAGLGIGLPFVDRMMKVHFGEDYGLIIESRIGHGTVMRLKFPVTRQHHAELLAKEDHLD